jgi:hypothetical protein
LIFSKSPVQAPRKNMLNINTLILDIYFIIIFI